MEKKFIKHRIGIPRRKERNQNRPDFLSQGGQGLLGCLAMFFFLNLGGGDKDVCFINYSLNSSVICLTLNILYSL